MRKWTLKMMGRGTFPDPVVFKYIQTHFLEEPARSRFGEFWLTAESIAGLPNRSLIPALPQAYAHCLRESLGEIPKSGQGDPNRWRDVSRDVVEARQRFEAVRGLPGADEGGALDALLAAVDEMEAAAHQDQGAAVRGLTNLIYKKTGARLVKMDPDPAVAFSRIKKELTRMAHGSGSWCEALALRDRAVAELARLFRPPDIQIQGLEALADVSSPSAQDVSELESIITNEHHLRFFFQRLPDADWLKALGFHELLAPSSHGGGWVVVPFVARLADTSTDDLVEWLAGAYGEWANLPQAAAAIAAAVRVLGKSGEELLLRILTEHPHDEGVRWQASLAVSDSDPSSEFVTEVAEMLLAIEG